MRVIEVASALTFQAPERLLLGITQAANALFTTLGTTGHVATALAAVGASVRSTVKESVDFVRQALKEPIPRALAAKASNGAAAVTSGKKRPAGRRKTAGR